MVDFLFLWHDWIRRIHAFNAAHIDSTLDQPVPLDALVGSPRVANNPVVDTTLSAVADCVDRVIASLSARTLVNTLPKNDFNLL